jgi:magnesium transporter
MLQVFIKFADGQISNDTSVEALKAAVHDDGAVFWLDMANPTEAEYSILKDVFGFHPLAIEDSIKYAQRPKIESYAQAGDAAHHGYFYMVVHGPDLETFREKLRTKELDIFLSERYLVTIHEEAFVALAPVLERAKSDARLLLDQGIDMLLHEMLDRMVDACQPILDYLQEQIDALEDEAVDCPTPDVLRRISQRKRDLLNFRRVVAPQREVIAQLTRGEVPFIRESTRLYLRDVQDHLNRAVETIEIYRDLVQGARDIYMSSISNNLNQIMKTLTVVSVIALPMTIVTSFFGMNFEAIPGIHSKVGFWWVVVIMFALVGGLLFLFRLKRWL